MLHSLKPSLQGDYLLFIATYLLYFHNGTTYGPIHCQFRSLFVAPVTTAEQYGVLYLIGDIKELEGVIYYGLKFFKIRNEENSSARLFLSVTERLGGTCGG